MGGLSAGATAAIIAGSSALSAGAGMASTAIKNKKQLKFQKEMQDRTFAYQKEMQDRTAMYNREMQDYAYSKDLEQWNRQNTYNSPAEQMKRYKEAGLNPNLIYSQQNTSNGSVTMGQTPMSTPTAPSAGQVNLQAVNFDRIADGISGGLQAYQNVLNSKEQRNQSRAYVNLLNADTDQKIFNFDRDNLLLNDYVARFRQQNKQMKLNYDLGQLDFQRGLIENDVQRRIFGYDIKGNHVDKNSLNDVKMAFQREQMNFAKNQFDFTKELQDMTYFTQRELKDVFDQIKANPNLINSDEIHARIRMLQMFGANIQTQGDQTWQRWLDRIGSGTNSLLNIGKTVGTFMSRGRYNPVESVDYEDYGDYKRKVFNYKK